VYFFQTQLTKSKLILIRYRQTWLKYIVSRLNDIYLDLYLMKQQKKKTSTKTYSCLNSIIGFHISLNIYMLLNKPITKYHILTNISFQNQINIYVYGNSEIASFTSLFKLLVV